MGLKQKPYQSTFAALSDMLDEIERADSEFVGSGAQRAADFEGVSQFTIYKQTDPDQGEGMPLARVARLTAKFKSTAVARHLAFLADGVFVPLPKADGSPLEMIEAVARTMQAGGAAFQEVSTDIADGVIDAGERARCLRKLDDLIAEAAALRARVGGEKEGR